MSLSLIKFGAGAAPTVTGADNGLSLSNGLVVLGQDENDPDQPALLTSIRQIPLGNYSVNFLTPGGPELIITHGGYFDWPIFHSTSYLGFASDVNFFLFGGAQFLPQTFDSWPILQLANGQGGGPSRYSGVIEGYTTGGNQDLLITTTINGTTGANVRIGDVIIRPGTNYHVDTTLTTQTQPASIFFEPFTTGTGANVGVVQIKNSGGTAMLGIGAATPSAQLTLSASTTAAGTSPIKITVGTLMTTPEDGAFEYDGTHLYFTIGSTRHILI